MKAEECIKKICKDAKKSNLEADVFISESETISIKCRKQKIEMIERSSNTLINARFIKNHKCVSATCNSFSNIDILIKKSLESLPYVPEDLNFGFSSQKNITSNINDYQITDNEIKILKDQAIKTDAIGNLAEKITNTNGSSFECSVKRIAFGNTNDLFAEFDKKTFSANTELIACDGNAMNPGSDYIICEKFENIIPENLASTAAKDAIQGLNPRKINTCQTDIIFESRCAASILQNFFSAVNASKVAQKSTFLRDSLEKQIFPVKTWVIDDPFNFMGITFGSFDGDGIARRKNILVENGILKTWALDVYNANKLKTLTNGMANRSSGGSVSPSASNLYLKSENSIDENELISQIKNGLYVTDVFGFGVNIVTGDYSQGAKGLWIENGELAFPVSEITIAGNLGDMFKNLIAANNLSFKGYITCPTIFVGKMTVSGK